MSCSIIVMASQTHELHRSLLRPAIIHALRAAGFHSTRPFVLDTLVSLAERFLLLLASTTVQHALNAHDDPAPTITDVRGAMQECGILFPIASASQEAWTELMRPGASELARGAFEGGGRKRVEVEKRKRQEEDVADITTFARWFEGSQYAEIKRVAGFGTDGAGAVGVGGNRVVADDFLTSLKRRKVGFGADEGRWVGTALGEASEGTEILIEGAPVQRLEDWRPPTVVELAATSEKDRKSPSGGFSSAAQNSDIG